jgi:hypothetical protein
VQNIQSVRYSSTLDRGKFDSDGEPQVFDCEKGAGAGVGPVPVDRAESWSWKVGRSKLKIVEKLKSWKV